MTRLPAFLRDFSDALDRAVIMASVSIVVAMLAVSMLGILFEVLFTLSERLGGPGAFVESPLYWAYAHTRASMTRLFLPWLAMLSLTVAFKRGEHVALEMAIRRLPRTALRAIQMVNLTVVALFAAALIWYGAIFFENSTQLFMVSATLQVSHKWTALSVPICGAVMCAHLLSGFALVEHAEVAPEVEG